MSSFVIAKSEYMKAAGLCAGIAEGLEIWMYSYKNNRNMNKQDYREMFEQIYTFNELSVAEQYRYEPSIDSGDYAKEFTKFYIAGRNAAITKEGLKDVIMELRQFFSGCLYQIEKESYYFQAEMFMNRFLVALMPQLHKHECESWGSICINFDNIRNIQRII